MDDQDGVRNCSESARGESSVESLSASDLGGFAGHQFGFEDGLGGGEGSFAGYDFEDQLGKAFAHGDGALLDAGEWDAECVVEVVVAGADDGEVMGDPYVGGCGAFHGAESDGIVETEDGLGWGIER